MDACYFSCDEKIKVTFDTPMPSYMKKSMAELEDVVSKITPISLLQIVRYFSKK